MATLNFSYTSEEAQAAQNDSFEALPAGIYIAQIERSDIKATRAGNGSYLSLGFKVIDGQYAGRWIWGNITLTNSNSQATEIGRKQLIKLANACGLGRVADSSELHGIPVKLKVKQGEYNGDITNEISDYHPADTASFGSPSAPMQTNVPTQTTKRPWERG